MSVITQQVNQSDFWNLEGSMKEQAQCRRGFQILSSVTCAFVPWTKEIMPLASCLHEWKGASKKYNE